VSIVTEYASSESSWPISTAPQVVAEVHRDLASVRAAWAELEEVAPASVYQTRAFLIPWLETIGRARKIEPFFIVARDRRGRVMALLPFGIERRGRWRRALFLGGKESNFNLGLFRPGVELSGQDLRMLLLAAAKALGPDAPHVYSLKNQPFEWEGVPNPFALLPHRLSPSFAYATRLGTSAESFLAAKLSKNARRRLRKKEARLAEMGPLALAASDSPGLRFKILDAFFSEKIARCEEQAIDADFSNPSVRDFFERLTRPTTTASSWLELYALMLGDRVIATYAGAAHRGQFSAMVNSFDTDPEIAKSSPGDLLLMKLIASQCEKGIAKFDLGIGEARYKKTYCEEAIPLFDVVIGLDASGQVYSALSSLSSRLKSTTKRSPHLFAALRGGKRVGARVWRALKR